MGGSERFAVIGLDAARAVDIDAWNAEIESGIMQALAAIGRGPVRWSARLAAPTIRPWNV
ncbi:MAG: hypothetical protein R3C70_09595 [Geminicoccaceae bacterium]